MEADRTLWEGQNPREAGTGGVSLPTSVFAQSYRRGSIPHVPVARIVVGGASMDLGMLKESSSIHISIAAERASVDDMRLMYRCLLATEMNPYLLFTYTAYTPVF